MVGCLLCHSSVVALADSSARQLIAFSLDELMQMEAEVTSVSKRREVRAEVPVALGVVTGEQIRRAGIVNLVEALRLVPGVQVSRLNGNEWAIGLRGFSWRFGRYLQVLLDGRSVYDPLFGGVNWDELNLPVEQIERIEVLRGPAGTTWGANAVLGVINIVTRAPQQLPDQALRVYLGNQALGGAYAAGRWLGDQWAWSGYADWQSNRGLEGQWHGERESNWRSQELGLVGTAALDAGDLRVQMRLYDLHNDALWPVTGLDGFSLANPGRDVFSAKEDKDGWVLQARWQQPLADGGQFQLRASADDIQRVAEYGRWATRHYDLDLEWQQPLGDAHLTQWGVNLRQARSDVSTRAWLPVQLSRHSEHYLQAGIFLQDRWQVRDDWDLTAGLRWEHNELSSDGQHWHLRSLWRLTPSQRFWMAFSHAESTPSRLTSKGTEVPVHLLPPQPMTMGLPTQIVVVGEQTLNNTELRALEMGYRWEPDSDWSVELSAFQHDYEQMLSIGNIRGALLNTVYGPVMQVLLDFADDQHVQTRGGEFEVKWQPDAQSRLTFWASYQEQDEKVVISAERLSAFGLGGVGIDAARSMAGLFWQRNLNERIDLDVGLRYVDDGGAGHQGESYLSGDVAMGYQWTDSLRVALSVRNLGDGGHYEGVREVFRADRYRVPMSVQLQLEWQQ